MATLEQAITQLRQCLVASKNRRDLGNLNPNFPDTPRYTISQSDMNELGKYFMDLQTTDGEFSHLYPTGVYRFEIATSGAAGAQVLDHKISQIQLDNSSGPAIFNFHIGLG